jgi:predicted metalloprotease with PDZ domain
MRKSAAVMFLLRWLVAALVGLFLPATFAAALEPIIYTVKAPTPQEHTAEIEAVIPVEPAPTVELMMPVWSPGYYKVEDYAGRVENLSAQGPDNTALAIEKDQKNRWRVQTGGARSMVLSYRLNCTGRSVTSNWVGEDFAVFNPGAMFIVPLEREHRSYEVRLELPPQWHSSISALDPTADGKPNCYQTDEYETLVDSPILAGKLSIREFDVAAAKHFVADAGEVGNWDSARAAENLQRIVGADKSFWGALPYQRYVFLNVFRQGAGGLEHRNCALLTTSSKDGPTGKGLRWLSFVSHEYFHAYNVKRLRPVELGPFDYEQPPSTESLWISEGLTNYYEDLLLCRAGLASPPDYLQSISNFIGQLQNSPGRLVQTLEQSSTSVWSGGTSGIGRDNKSTVSYYVKGPVVGFLLDARIRRTTAGKKSLDDVMRLAYQRYGGEHGFKPQQFREVAEEVAGCSLEEWFHRALATTEELDYSEALDWYGLRFAPSENPQEAWKLEPRQDATAEQTAHLHALTDPGGPP